MIYKPNLLDESIRENLSRMVNFVIPIYVSGIEKEKQAEWTDMFNNALKLSYSSGYSEAVATAEKSQVWQPIETAPKDGTHFLVTYGDSPFPLHCAWLTQDKIDSYFEEPEDSKEGFYEFLSEHSYYDPYYAELSKSKVTHWMPMPELPTC